VCFGNTRYVEALLLKLVCSGVLVSPGWRLVITVSVCVSLRSINDGRSFAYSTVRLADSEYICNGEQGNPNGIAILEDEGRGYRGKRRKTSRSTLSTVASRTTGIGGDTAGRCIRTPAKTGHRKAAG
jgi:hypothetical protein